MSGVAQDHVVMSGYLNKRKTQQNISTGNQLLSWNRRWFVVTVDSLKYYRRKDSKRPKGTISLSDVTRIRKCEQENGLFW
jgi:hypothetical protein